MFLTSTSKVTAVGALARYGLVAHAAKLVLLDEAPLASEAGLSVNRCTCGGDGLASFRTHEILT
jgi:hypothetical protein